MRKPPRRSPEMRLSTAAAFAIHRKFAGRPSMAKVGVFEGILLRRRRQTRTLCLPRSFLRPLRALSRHRPRSHHCPRCYHRSRPHPAPGIPRSPGTQRVGGERSPNRECEPHSGEHCLGDNVQLCQGTLAFFHSCQTTSAMLFIGPIYLSSLAFVYVYVLCLNKSHWF